MGQRIGASVSLSATAPTAGGLHFFFSHPAFVSCLSLAEQLPRAPWRPQEHHDVRFKLSICALDQKAWPWMLARTMSYAPEQFAAIHI